MRLTSANGPYFLRSHRAEILRRGVQERGAGRREDLCVVRGRSGSYRGQRSGRVEHVRVRRDLRDRQRVRLFAATLAERVTATDMNGRAAAQIGQREVHAAIAAEGRAEQREQWLILIDR